MAPGILKFCTDIADRCRLPGACLAINQDIGRGFIMQRWSEDCRDGINLGRPVGKCLWSVAMPEYLTVFENFIVSEVFFKKTH